MCTISIIAAVSQNNVIGNNNTLPWKLPSDMKHFRNLTQNSVVVMGRKTYESIGKPLPNRLNVVLSSQKDLCLPSDVTVVHSPTEALKASRLLCLKHNVSNVWIIGGAGVYQQFIKRADRMVLTVLDKPCVGDTFFPQFKPNLWELKQSAQHTDSVGYTLDQPETLGLSYTINEYERIL
jgi:dihydrofolate reductase